MIPARRPPDVLLKARFSAVIIMRGLSLSTSVSDGWRSHQAVQHPDSDVQPQQLPPVHHSILPEPPPALSYKPGLRFLPGKRTPSLVLKRFVPNLAHFGQRRANIGGSFRDPLFSAFKTECHPSVCVLEQQQKDSSICPLDPVELLRQVEEALRDRPPHLHRNFVYINHGDDVASSPIRVMQWNILAQGRRLHSSQYIFIST